MNNFTISINIQDWYLNLLLILFSIITVGKLIVNYYEIKLIKLNRKRNETI